MTEQKRREILAANKAMADKALRVLAVALRALREDALGADPREAGRTALLCGACRHD